MLQFISLCLYRLIFICLLPFLLLALILRSKNNPDYRRRLGERLGFTNRTFEKNSIIIHAASVGEVLALKPLVEKLLQQQPALIITFTTFTPTGSAQVNALFNERVQHCYLPLDIWPCTTLFLNTLQPKAMVFMETELWPNLLAQCAHKNIKLMLINARLSEKSVKSYQKISALIQPALTSFQHIYCQSQDNLERFLTLGATVNSTSVSGNLKYDIAINPAVLSKQEELKQYILTPRKVWVVASTHQGDEKLVLSAFEQVKLQHPDLLLILVPRHPERFDTIATQCQQQFKTARRSTNIDIKADTDVWLLDSLGELLAAFALADIVTMGGSFSSVGGHNPLEPALFTLPIIVGPDMHNFTDVMQQLTQQQGVIQLEPTDNISNALPSAVITLLAQPDKARVYGENAHNVVLANQGASQRSIDKLLEIIA